METNIGIKKEHLAEGAQILNKFLADEVVLYIKTRNAHWNVEGHDFHEKHLFFETQYEQLDEMMDEVAERVRALGHYASGTLKSFLELTHLSELSRGKNDGPGFVKELLQDHESIITRLRENISHFADKLNDPGTSDFITGLMEKHEKMAWMLRVQLK
jgi:starvation-inducible DNA-binding protein